MIYLRFILTFFSLSIFAQETIEATFIKEIKIKSDQLISVDNFETLSYVNNNVFFRKTPNKTLSYTNIQLGNLNSVNTFNKLKANLFYQDFNTVIILDNRLSEIFKIDFNTIQPYKNITKVSTGHDNTIWIFNQNNLQLELYDYKNNITRAKTLPIKNEVLALQSNYNYSFLLTKAYLYVYNYFGSLVSKIKNLGFDDLAENNGNIVLKKNNTLFYLKKGQDKVQLINTPKNLINRFFVTNESLYIYNNESLQQFQLKI